MFNFNLANLLIYTMITPADSVHNVDPIDLSEPLDDTRWKSLIDSIELPADVLLDGEHYRLIQEFERGGAGRVFMAVHNASQTQAVIKLWSPRGADHLAHDLKTQVRSLEVLQPMVHTPQVFALTAEGRALVLEFVSGPTGTEWIQAPRDFQVDLPRIVMIERTTRNLFKKRIHIPDPHAQNWIFNELTGGELTMIDPGGIKVQGKRKLRSPHQTIGTPRRERGLLETMQLQHPSLFLFYGAVSRATDEGSLSTCLSEQQFDLLLEGDHWFDFLFQSPVLNEDRRLRRTFIKFLRRHPMADVFLKLHVDDRLTARITGSATDQALEIFRTAAIEGLHSSDFPWQPMAVHLMCRGVNLRARLLLRTIPLVKKMVGVWYALFERLGWPFAIRYVERPKQANKV